MTTLLFTADGLLCEQAPGAEPRALSRVVEGAGEGAARLTADAREYEIVPLSQSGWGFDLRDGQGARVGGFRPFRLRSGGHLRVREIGVSLHGRPWSHEGWAFSLPDGRRVEATVQNTGDVTAKGDGAAAGSAAAAAAAAPSAGSFAVVLEADAPLQPPALVEVLALGSWLIARWHSTPADDHVLASAGPGARTASATAKPTPAGNGARTAN